MTENQPGRDPSLEVDPTDLEGASREIATSAETSPQNPEQEKSKDFLASEKFSLLEQLKNFITLPEDGKAMNILLKTNGVMLSGAAIFASTADRPSLTGIATLALGGLTSFGAAKLQAMLENSRGRL